MEIKVYKAPAPGDLVLVYKDVVYRPQPFALTTTPPSRGEEIMNWEWPSSEVKCTALLVSEPEWVMVLERSEGKLWPRQLCQLLTRWGIVYAHLGKLHPVTVSD